MKEDARDRELELPGPEIAPALGALSFQEQRHADRGHQGVPQVVVLQVDRGITRRAAGEKVIHVAEQPPQ